MGLKSRYAEALDPEKPVMLRGLFQVSQKGFFGKAVISWC